MASELNRSITGPTSGSSTAFSAFNRSYGTALGVIAATLVSCFIFIIFDRTSLETTAITQGPAPYFSSTQDTCDRCDLVVFSCLLCKILLFRCFFYCFYSFPFLPFPLLPLFSPFLSDLFHLLNLFSYSSFHYLLLELSH